MNATQEQWRPVVGWEDFYEVSDQGRMRSVDRVIVDRNGCRKKFRGRLLKPISSKQGYLCVSLCRPGRTRISKIHQLVAAAFIGPRPDGMDTCHGNDIRTDNRAVNLRYDTHSENARDHVRAGNHYEAKRTHCPRGHVLDMPNLQRKKWETKRQRCCLACTRASNRVYKRPELRPQYDQMADHYYELIMSKATDWRS